MDEDLTASHWDDVPSSSQPIIGPPNIGLIFDSLSLEDPHRDPLQDTEESTKTYGDQQYENENEEEENEEKHYDNTSSKAIDQSFTGAYGSVNSPFQASTNLNQSEIDELSEIRKQERDTHKSSLLMELTNGVEDIPETETPLTPIKFSASESLFEDRGSPIKIQPTSSSASEPLAKSALINSITSPIKANLLKTGKFKAARARKMPAKTVIKHLDDGQNGDFDPLSSLAAPQKSTAEENSSLLDKTKKLFQEVDLPLYDLPKGNESNTEDEDSKKAANSSEPKSPCKSEEIQSNSNDLEISLGDPIKVGDITTAHIVYDVKSRNKNPESIFFPQTGEPIHVSRRYKDFRWIYHQLQNNHPGKIIPPPPSKQTYIGRFNENFIENRRLSLEKMLQKISKTPAFANDGDFVLFLTSQNFANDAKERDQVSGSGASLQASNGDDDSDKSGPAIVTGTSTGGFMSSLFSMTVKYPEPDDFFSKKKGYIEDLEYNLKTFYKSLELIATQRIEIAAVIGEISSLVEELAELEILKTTTDLLSAFAEVHAKLKENLDRVNLQDQLTLGFTIEEYLRIIGSVKSTFEARSKVYQLYQSFKQDLMKKEDSLDRLNSRYKSSVDKINQVSFEVDKLKQKVSHYEESFKSISDTIKAELDNFEMEKIQDFRNSVEIFIESSIESQKEAIELWETFYERQKLTLV